MKNLILILFLLIGLTQANAQYSDLVLYSTKGYRFYVYLNGIQQNIIPAPVVKITDMPSPNYKLDLVFTNPMFNRLEKDLFIKQGKESNFSVVKKNQKEFKIKLVSEVPKINDTIHVVYRQIVKYRNTPIPSKNLKAIDRLSTLNSP